MSLYVVSDSLFQQETEVRLLVKSLFPQYQIALINTANLTFKNVTGLLLSPSVS